MSTRKPYPSEVSNDEWAFVAPYVTLVTEHALQRKHDRREVDNGLRWLVRTGAQGRMLPHDFPRWEGRREAVSQQPQRGLRAGCFEAMAHDLRLRLRLAAGHGKGNPRPSSWTHVPCRRRLRAARERATMGISAATDAKAIWRSTRWASCWRG
jgi:transposase